MDSIDWTAKAVLHQRDDAGSDMNYDFDTIGEGRLAAMIALVLEMPPHDRARGVLDVAGHGMLEVNRIVALSQRADYPAQP